MEIQQDLIDRCLKGDKKAENELYKVLYSFLMSICRRYIRQEEKAREVLNIGFCRLLINISKYQPVAPFQYWARKIMVNVLISEHKKEKLHYGNHSYVDSYHEDEKFAEINMSVEKFGVKRIVQFIEKLPAASRQVFPRYSARPDSAIRQSRHRYQARGATRAIRDAALTPCPLYGPLGDSVAARGTSDITDASAQ